MEVKRREVGNLVLEDVPESVPPHITQRLEQYQNTRGANLHEWHRASADSADQVEGMLISTRFADTTQLHYISRPTGYFFLSLRTGAPAAALPHTLNLDDLYTQVSQAADVLQGARAVCLDVPQPRVPIPQ
jgi:hypothetical protein